MLGRCTWKVLKVGSNGMAKKKVDLFLINQEKNSMEWCNIHGRVSIRINGITRIYL